MNILGISGSTHDSSASLIINDEVFMAIEEERLTRRKHATGQKPVNAIKALLRNSSLSPRDIDLVSYFINPRLHSLQAPSHVLFGDPRRYFLHPKIYRTTSFLGRGQRYLKDLEDLLKQLGITSKVEYVQHHLAHAAGAFFPSGLRESMVLVVDNMGELDSTTLLYGEDKSLDIIKTQKISHSLGMFYGAITSYLGFKPWDEEGKVMALAAYGKPILPLEKMILLNKGGFKVQNAFQMIQTSGYERCYSDDLVELLGPARKPDEPITQLHRDIAASVQYATEETCKHLVRYLHELTGSHNLCVAGGVALNCKMNGELARLPFIERIYVPSAPGDNGSSLGAAIYSLVKHGGVLPSPIYFAGLGQEFDDSQIRDAIVQSGISFSRTEDPANAAADLLLNEGIIAWYQGRSEFGPRALGHRSILALPQKEATRDFINQHVKHREPWRPLCPSILSDRSFEYTENSSNNRFMNIASYATANAPSQIPAVIHIDNTARVQAVYRIESDVFFRLLELIGERTGNPVVLNTSFNARGEPIVDSPSDALNSYKQMPINSLVMGTYVVRKNGQS